MGEGDQFVKLLMAGYSMDSIATTLKVAKNVAYNMRFKYREQIEEAVPFELRQRIYTTYKKLNQYKGVYALYKNDLPLPVVNCLLRFYDYSKRQGSELQKEKILHLRACQNQKCGKRFSAPLDSPCPHCGFTS